MSYVDIEDRPPRRTPQLPSRFTWPERSLSIACVAGAVVLAIYGVDGWGWLLLLAFLFA